jgi:hypothetical protein
MGLISKSRTGNALPLIERSIEEFDASESGLFQDCCNQPSMPQPHGTQPRCIWTRCHFPRFQQKPTPLALCATLIAHSSEKHPFLLLVIARILSQALTPDPKHLDRVSDPVGCFVILFRV